MHTVASFTSSRALDLLRLRLTRKPDKASGRQSEVDATQRIIRELVHAEVLRDSGSTMPDCNAENRS